jgi:hypothetical protein
MDMLAEAIREKGDSSPQAQALLNLCQLLKDAGQPAPPPPPKKAENRNFLDDFIEKADAVRDREVRDAQATRADSATRQRMIEQARQKHQARLQAARALCEKVADDSLPPEESARLQYTFIGIELPAVEADCRRLGIG